MTWEFEHERRSVVRQISAVGASDATGDRVAQARTVRVIDPDEAFEDPALWVLVALVLTMAGLHRLLARQVRHVEHVPRGQEGLDPDEWHRFLAATDPPDRERRDELVSVG